MTADAVLSNTGVLNVLEGKNYGNTIDIAPVIGLHAGRGAEAIAMMKGNGEIIKRRKYV